MPGGPPTGGGSPGEPGLACLDRPRCSIVSSSMDAGRRGARLMRGTRWRRRREGGAHAARASSIRSRLWMTGVLAITGMPLSCGGSADPPPAGTVRDSSGVRIVEDVPIGEPNATWSVSEEPLYRIGWADDDPPFEDVTAGAILADGRAVVGDQGSSLLYWISPEGRVLSRAGGPGQGPGELGGIATIVHTGGDTVLVQDDGNLRVNSYVGSELVGERRFEHYFAGAFYHLAGRREGGGFVLVPAGIRLTREMADMQGWLDFPVLGVSSDFGTVDTITHLGIMQVPNTRNPIYNWGQTSALGGRVVYARRSRPEVRWFAPDGSLRQVARLALVAEEAGEDLWAEYEADYRQRSSGLDPAVVEERLAEARAAFGGTRPFFGQAHMDRDGHVWLSGYSIIGSETDTYMVVSADGATARRVVFPSELRILDIAYDRVLAVETDDFDVEAVVLYELQRGGG